ncbi:NACHT domain-containing protein [Dactylosporangium salmoneum]|uniref:AAA+ ATPase domain-containing protein n=1 Tax=Dactylosporangium salmoneum TaxID=53361 RepID=A0ABN3FQ92_9ACTN
MSRKQTLTFEGALRIMGAMEPDIFSRLGRALGGAILASGVAAGIATVGPAAVAPLAALAPIWGWIDRKNEAMPLLRELMDALRTRIATVPTRRRRELVTAAHTTLVVSAFFDALAELLGAELVEQLDLREDERLALALGGWGDAHAGLVRHLYEARIPAPSAVTGFEGNIANVEAWIEQLAARTEVFLQGLSAWRQGASLPDTVVALAVARYREQYVALAASVPEFSVWTVLDEQAATRHEVHEVGEQLERILSLQRDDLRRIEAILSLASGRGEPQSEPQGAVMRSNHARLEREIVRREETDPLSAVCWPTVGAAFVAPSYRATCVTAASRVADETWWRSRPRRDDLDLWFSSYALSDDSTRVPLMLLGHPGAGKSMLMKVLAARLPAADYTVVLVPLRTVSANAPILEQIQQALDQSTNRRVEWSQLADSSLGTTRVVILDGLDELLQASNTDRSGFMQEVMAFQRIEAEQDRPVMVIVTSRTVVADRVDIPSGSLVLKLDDFDDEQIGRWLGIWNETNAAPIASGAVRPLSTDVALTQPELACQPLLLLILAIYSADPDAAPLDAGVSSTELYQRIFDSFARREVLKSGNVPVSEVDGLIEEKIERLCVAALAMFNRGSQSVAEDELSADLSALYDGTDPRVEEPGRRLLGEFFFVYTAEATVIGAGEGPGEPGRGSRSRKRSRRSYEFLHATFGEYLVAQRVLEELRDVADQAFSGRRPRDPEGHLLYALLSHHPLAVRRSTLSFLAGLFSDLDETERSDVVRALDFLIQNYRRHPGAGKYQTYQPTRIDHLRQLAVYSANLIAVRVALIELNGSLHLRELSRDPAEFDAEWEALLALWKAGLDADGWHTMISLLHRDGDALVSLNADKGSMVRGRARKAIEATTITADYLHARLAGDADGQARLKLGIVLNDEMLIDDGRDNVSTLLAALYSIILGTYNGLPGIDNFGAGIDEPTGRKIGGTIERLVADRQPNTDLLSVLFRIVVDLGLIDELDSTIVFLNACRFPEVIERVPRLEDPSFYKDPALALLIARCVPPADGVVKRQGGAGWRSLLISLRRADPRSAALVDDLPNDVTQLIGRLVFAIRDDRHSVDGARIATGKNLRAPRRFK